jgi:hypothetical protein
MCRTSSPRFLPHLFSMIRPNNGHVGMTEGGTLQVGILIPGCTAPAYSFWKRMVLQSGPHMQYAEQADIGVRLRAAVRTFDWGSTPLNPKDQRSETRVSHQTQWEAQPPITGLHVRFVAGREPEVHNAEAPLSYQRGQAYEPLPPVAVLPSTSRPRRYDATASAWRLALWPSLSIAPGKFNHSTPAAFSTR